MASTTDFTERRHIPERRSEFGISTTGNEARMRRRRVCTVFDLSWKQAVEQAPLSGMALRCYLIE
jgi:hypothetical protein